MQSPDYPRSGADGKRCDAALKEPTNHLLGTLFAALFGRFLGAFFTVAFGC